MRLLNIGTAKPHDPFHSGVITRSRPPSTVGSTPTPSPFPSPATVAGPPAPPHIDCYACPSQVEPTWYNVVRCRDIVCPLSGRVPTSSGAPPVLALVLTPVSRRLRAMYTRESVVERDEPLAHVVLLKLFTDCIAHVAKCTLLTEERAHFVL
jgi:hypothetical protein